MLLSNPGVSQTSTELNGALGLIQKVGNFHTVRPNIAEKAGLWLLNINSIQPYTIRVVGKVILFHFPLFFVDLSRLAVNK